MKSHIFHLYTLHVFLGGDYFSQKKITSNTPTHIIALVSLKLNIHIVVLNMERITKKTCGCFMHNSNCNNHISTCYGLMALYNNLHKSQANHLYVYIVFHQNVYYIKECITTIPYITIKSDIINKMGVRLSQIKNQSLHWMFSCKYDHFTFCRNGKYNIYDIEYNVMENRYYMILCIHKDKRSKTFHIHHDDKIKLGESPKKRGKYTTRHSCFCKNVNMYDIKKCKLQPSGKSDVRNIFYLMSSLGLYDTYKDLFLFLSKLKTISFDIETCFSDLSNEELQPNVSDFSTKRSTLKAYLKPISISFSSFLSEKQMIKILTSVCGIKSLGQCDTSLLYRVRSSVLKMGHDEYTKLIHTLTNLSSDYETYTFFDADQIRDFFYKLVYISQLVVGISVICTTKLLTSLNGIQTSMFSVLRQLIRKFVSKVYVFGFNNAKFDSVLLQPQLIPIAVDESFTVRVFKKNQNIINCILRSPCRYWVNKKDRRYFGKIYKKKMSDQSKFVLPQIEIHIRDLRGICPFGTLSDLGTQYNLPISKLSFPYGFLQSTTLLKSITPYNITDSQYDKYWKDSLYGTQTSVSEQQLIISDFRDSKCTTLFHYMLVYLKRDVILLHTLVSSVLESYQSIGFNFILANKFTLSSISYSLFMVYYKMNDATYICPYDCDDTFINSILAESVVGGYTCSFVQGKVRCSYIYKYTRHIPQGIPLWPILCIGGIGVTIIGNF